MSKNANRALEAQIAKLEAENTKLKKALGDKKGVNAPEVPTESFKVQNGENVEEYVFNKSKFAVPGYGKVTAAELLASQDDERTQAIIAYLVENEATVIKKIGSEPVEAKEPDAPDA